MKKQSDEIRKVEEALIHFHRKPRCHSIDPAWQEDVMSRIVREAPPRSVPALNGSGTARTAWRFALAASLVALLLAGYLIVSNRDVQYQMAELILDDSTNADLAGSFINR
ncbi:hypothetical protein [Desulforhabdus amnigena]|jgi:hypothetical protein|uniref:DUF3619 family protein n=1 Tax=Desulforhabdus amnigena TaxID=40218 RepID=A0A9W6FWL8_9BACT|nr:hypothetical protein [Desulforhabdus amnigena]NLJ29483.1 hypothetical protein [Deltaproteobacteria bacterium]GLI36167.1 hypothetical protein DAMNIGENAA_36000 [Desulforhabdus amnigena]